MKNNNKMPGMASKFTGNSNNNNNNKKTTFYSIIAVLITLLGATLIALFSYSTAGYKKAIANDVRIAVIETRQEVILEKLNEISTDIKKILENSR